MTLCTFHSAHGIERPATKLIGEDAMCADCFAGKPITQEQAQYVPPPIVSDEAREKDRQRAREYYYQSAKRKAVLQRGTARRKRRAA